MLRDGKKIYLCTRYGKENMRKHFNKISNKIRAQINTNVNRLKVWKYISGKKISPKTLDHLALFAGFQTWDDLRSAVRGDSDGQTNYKQ